MLVFIPIVLIPSYFPNSMLSDKTYYAPEKLFYSIMF